MGLRRRVFWGIWGVYLLAFMACTVLALPATREATTSATREWVWVASGMIAGLVTAIVMARRVQDVSQGFVRVLEPADGGPGQHPLPHWCRQDAEELAWAVDQFFQTIRQETARQQSDYDRLRTILDSMVEGVIAVDADQRILLVNAAAEKLFHLRSDSVSEFHFWELIRQPNLQRLVGQALAEKKPMTGEVELRDPTPMNLVVNIAPFPSKLERGAVIVSADVTELRRLERVRQEFVANASHELKTPLASIKACVETLLDGAADDAQFRDRFLLTINESADRLDLLVKDMLTLARIETEPVPRDSRPVDLVDLGRRCLDRLQQTAERKQVQLNYEPQEVELPVSAGEEALEQILGNLLDNAIKYTDPQGQVTLRLRGESGYGVIDVIDTGIGIPHNQVPRIFERFYRVDRHRSRDQGGTGLGLAIVKHLVQALSGSISVNSRLQQGTTFTVRLPLPGKQRASAASSEG